MIEKNKIKKYNVQIERISSQQAVAKTHGQKITLAIDGTDPTFGFTAPEIVLAAFGACILSNITKGASKMGLQIKKADIKFTALKRIEPLGFKDLEYIVTIESSESKEKIEALYKLSTTNGTATNALLEGLKPQSRLNIQP